MQVFQENRASGHPNLGNTICLHHTGETASFPTSKVIFSPVKDVVCFNLLKPHHKGKLDFCSRGCFVIRVWRMMLICRLLSWSGGFTFLCFSPYCPTLCMSPTGFHTPRQQGQLLQPLAELQRDQYWQGITRGHHIFLFLWDVHTQSRWRAYT